MRRIAIIIVLTIISFLAVIPFSYAHPGNTASDGCHYCRTNCDSWGQLWNQRHCHGGYSSPPASNYSAYSAPSCPSNSSYNSSKGKCSCNYGYGPSLNKKTCIKIPKNAHSVISSTDVLMCNNGYEEKGNSCSKINNEINNTTSKIASNIKTQESNNSDSTTNALVAVAVVGGAYFFGKNSKS